MKKYHYGHKDLRNHKKIERLSSSFLFAFFQQYIFLFQEDVIVELVASEFLDFVHGFQNVLFPIGFIELELGQAEISLNIVFQKSVGFVLVEVLEKVEGLLVFFFGLLVLFEGK